MKKLHKGLIVGFMMLLGMNIYGTTGGGDTPTTYPRIHEIETDIVAHIKTGNALSNGIKVNVNSVVLEHLTKSLHDYFNKGGTTRTVKTDYTIELSNGNSDGKLPLNTKVELQIKGDAKKNGYLMPIGTSLTDSTPAPKIINLLQVKVYDPSQRYDKITVVNGQLITIKGSEKIVTYGGSEQESQKEHSEIIEYTATGGKTNIHVESIIKMGDLDEAVVNEGYSVYTNDSRLVIRIPTA